MSQSISDRVRWTTADLELLPDNGNRYEIIDGDLFVRWADHWNHQVVCGSIYTALNTWSQKTGLGESVVSPGIIFTDVDCAIPDVV
ncbi:MAG TPA: Uma2 family endonuclease, partial [Kamptonema sp.]|nr:Uma2 family endonuclease [Kamptonema sp.]